MALTTEAALRKDKTNAGATMEHRHFATIADIIARSTFHGFTQPAQERMADYFASELAKTNPKFDRACFLCACNAEDRI